MNQTFDIKPFSRIAIDQLDCLKKMARLEKKEIKKISLISPLQIPSDFFDVEMAERKRYFCYPPYGLGLVARELKAVGFEVNIVDLNHAVLSNIDGFVANRENFEKEFLQEFRKAHA